MKVYAWPDGSFVKEVYFCEIEYASFGDDYMIITVHDDIVSNGDIDEYVLQKVNGQ
ncbi:MAG: hypothetical protein GQ540_03200 [Lutibacter sp.]|uniref:hypothetical protein n=1 Tax=Lutibacter sp. TaxID=1925666 RepID=UPI0019DD99B8|nr:hypothetical protein [Lutibacter sp.]NOR27518.1 hypothetical protein [Lutibacter sp.]